MKPDHNILSYGYPRLAARLLRETSSDMLDKEHLTAALANALEWVAVLEDRIKAIESRFPE